MRELELGSLVSISSQAPLTSIQGGGTGTMSLELSLTTATSSRTSSTVRQPRATRRDSLTMSWILRSQAYLAPVAEVEGVLVFITSLSCLPSSTQPCSNSTQSQVSEFLARTSLLTPALWWILETTAKSEMDLEKQKPAERTLSPPEVEEEASRQLRNLQGIRAQNLQLEAAAAAEAGMIVFCSGMDSTEGFQQKHLSWPTMARRWRSCLTQTSFRTLRPERVTLPHLCGTDQSWSQRTHEPLQRVNPSSLLTLLPSVQNASTAFLLFGDGGGDGQ